MSSTAAEFKVRVKSRSSNRPQRNLHFLDSRLINLNLN